MLDTLTDKDHEDQVVSQVLKIILNRFPVTSLAEMMYDMTKKNFHQLLDGLYLVLVVDVCEGVQHVSEVFHF